MAPGSNAFNIEDTKLIKQLFPNVRWQKVVIGCRLPWYLKNSFAYAAVLPENYHSKVLKIVLRGKSSQINMLNTLFHEAVHLQQYQDLDKEFPFGIGFFRSFMMHYLGWSLTLFINGFFIKKLKLKEAKDYAYMNNPLEIEAYTKGEAFFYLITKHKISFDSQAFIEAYPNISVYRSDYKGRPPLWAFIPAIILCLLVFITKPILDFFAFVAEQIQSLFKKQLKK